MPLRILLADDSEVNQEVGLIHLKKLGYLNCDTACDGRDAIQKLRQKQYDVVFMDCQMPIMDGFDATRSIRSSQGEPFKNVYIIAMTANAMMGDKERCIESGMSDYVSKPVEIRALKESLARCVEFLKAAPAKTQTPAAPKSQREDIDQCVDETVGWAPSLETSGEEGMEALAAYPQRIVDIFIQETDRCFEDIQACHAEKDIRRMTRAAHTLKGTSAQFGLSSMEKICAEMEEIAKKGQWDKIPATVIKARSSFEKFRVRSQAAIL